jgi:hypothetical protein
MNMTSLQHSKNVEIKKKPPGALPAAFSCAKYFVDTRVDGRILFFGEWNNHCMLVWTALNYNRIEHLYDRQHHC